MHFAHVTALQMSSMDTAASFTCVITRSAAKTHLEWKISVGIRKLIIKTGGIYKLHNP